MSKVLIIGGTKFIGKEIAKQCLEHDHEIKLFNRGKTTNNFNVETIIGDTKEITNYKAEFLKYNPDFVIHCIAYTEKHANDIVDIFKGTKTKLIVLGSVDCYDHFTQFTRGKETHDFPIDELSQTSSIKYYWKGILDKSMNDYDKNIMTDVLINSYNEDLINTTIFRLPLVYGPEDYQYNGRHGSIIRRIIDKKTEFVLGATEQSRIWTFGYIENIVSAIIHSLGKNQTDGKIYNLGENNFRSWKRWCDLYAEINNWQFEYIILPDELIESSRKLLNKIPMHIISSSDLFINDTGYKPKFSIESAIEKTYKWAYDNLDKIKLTEINYKKEQESILKYQAFLS